MLMQFSGPFSRCYAHLLLGLLLLLAACSSATPTPEPTTAPLAGSCSLPATSDDESAIRALLVAEGEFVVTQAIDPLMQLWSDDARIVDAKNTPDDPNDDQVWDGKDAIRNRYVNKISGCCCASAESS